MTFEINTALLFALMPATLALVNFVKSFGVEGKLLMAVSMGIGVGLAIAAQLLPAGIFQIIYNGLVLGLAACGLFDLGKMIASKLPPTQ